MGPRSILIIGNYGAGNLGDDAILGGIVTELRSIAYAGEIQVTHGGVVSSPEIYKGLKKVPFLPVGLRSRFKKNRHEAFAALKRADLVILGGGGLFVDEESWRAPFIWAGQAKACRKAGKPYLIYGQSVGPLKRWWSRRLMRQTFKHARAVHLRDASASGTIGTDPAFAWLLQEKRSIPRKPVLLVSLRQWPGLTDLKPLVKEIQVYAKRHKLKPILLSMDTREHLESYGLELYQAHSAREAFEAFEKAQLAVTMRLHAGIFAVAAGTPVVALAYSQKVKALLEGNCTVLSEITPEKLREALKKLNKKILNVEAKLVKNQEFLTENLAKVWI
jgi:polysaccharide pyruvyl transferase CsaB